MAEDFIKRDFNQWVSEVARFIEEEHPGQATRVAIETVLSYLLDSGWISPTNDEEAMRRVIADLEERLNG